MGESCFLAAWQSLVPCYHLASLAQPSVLDINVSDVWGTQKKNAKKKFFNTVTKGTGAVPPTWFRGRSFELTLKRGAWSWLCFCWQKKRLQRINTVNVCSQCYHSFVLIGDRRWTTSTEVRGEELTQTLKWGSPLQPPPSGSATGYKTDC